MGNSAADCGMDSAVFHLGAAAEEWCDKILHPKSRIEKWELNRKRECLCWASSSRSFFTKLPGSQSP